MNENPEAIPEGGSRAIKLITIPKKIISFKRKEMGRERG
jgi:hypothetical protein